MFTLCDLHFVLCSLNLDVLRAQTIIGFSIFITHKSMSLENLSTWIIIDCVFKIKLKNMELALAPSTLFGSVYIRHYKSYQLIEGTVTLQVYLLPSIPCKIHTVRSKCVQLQFKVLEKYKGKERFFQLKNNATKQ